MNETIKTKICSKCKVEQDVSCFHKNKNEKFGLQVHCKKCAKQYRQSDPEKIARKSAEYYNANKDSIAIKKKIYNKINKKAMAEQKKIYNKANRESKIEYARQYRKENKAKISIKLKEYYILNKEKILRTTKAYRQTPMGKCVSKNKRHNRNLLTKQGDVTTKELLELQQNSKVCYWCGVSLKKAKVHIDHYVPLSKGGLHTLSNLVVSCQRCNNQKHAKDPLDFANSLGRLL